MWSRKLAVQQYAMSCAAVDAGSLPYAFPEIFPILPTLFFKACWAIANVAGGFDDGGRYAHGKMDGAL